MDANFKWIFSINLPQSGNRKGMILCCTRYQSELFEWNEQNPRIKSVQSLQRHSQRVENNVQVSQKSASFSKGLVKFKIPLRKAMRPLVKSLIFKLSQTAQNPIEYKNSSFLILSYRIQRPPEIYINKLISNLKNNSNILWFVNQTPVINLWLFLFIIHFRWQEKYQMEYLCLFLTMK